MKKSTAAEAPAEAAPVAATAEEITRAIEKLDTADFVRLKTYAENRIRRIGPWAANGRTDGDLLNEAVTRLLDGTRHWYPEKTGIVTCLLGAVRSISSSWAGHRKRNQLSPEYAALESDKLKKDEEGNTVSPFDGLMAEGSHIEDQLVDAEIEADRKALADEIEAACAGEEDSLVVIVGWQSDMDGPAIQKEMGWTETKYRTVARRIQRRAHKIAERRYGKQAT